MCLKAEFDVEEVPDSAKAVRSDAHSLTVKGPPCGSANELVNTMNPPNLSTDMLHDPDDYSTNPSQALTMGQLIDQRLSRRQVLKQVAGGMLAVSVAGTASRSASAAERETSSDSSSLTFSGLEHGLDDKMHVAEGYRAQVLIRWGDPVLPGAPQFHPQQQTAQRQVQQFGYNNDFIAFLPLPLGSNNSRRGLLCVNHEYTDPWLMFPGITPSNSLETLSREQVEIEMAAHGHSVVEIQRVGPDWKVVLESPYNRRLTALDTKMKFSGPAASADKLKTTADPTGTQVIGTINNCAGGVTPWGTVLIAEENFNKYFAGESADPSQTEAFQRYGIGGKPSAAWFRFHDRFDLAKEPNEANRFGWMVELDPYHPELMPVKRTSMGRLKHEGATPVLSPDGHVVVYSGDDQAGDYLYKFVSAGKYDPDHREANRDLLDEGILYVAKFDSEGVTWLPMEQGKGPLVASGGFHSQADVLINARLAADALGATPLDRPEDVEVDPVTGRVYVMLTNNSSRGTAEGHPVDGVNPRARNIHGHVLEIIPPGTDGKRDHAAIGGKWEVFLRAGNPQNEEDQALYHPGVSSDGWLTCPDNAAFDSRGRMWIATDGAQWTSKMADGLYATDTTGPGRALTKLFFRGPTGCETCGPYFTPDDGTLFVAVQHPAEEPNSTFDNPSTRWPDYDPELPPRPSVVAITPTQRGQVVGGR